MGQSGVAEVDVFVDASWEEEVVGGVDYGVGVGFGCAVGDDVVDVGVAYED